MALRWCTAGMVETGMQLRRSNGHLHLTRTTRPQGMTASATRIQVGLRVRGRSTNVGVRRLAVGRRRGGRFLGSGPWRVGLVSCPSMPPSRRTGTPTAHPSLPRALGTVDIRWRVARRWGRRQCERSSAGRPCCPRGGSLVASRSSSCGVHGHVRPCLVNSRRGRARNGQHAPRSSPAMMSGTVVPTLAGPGLCRLRPPN
ncbi:MAG: hypothetical protein QOI36_453 [Pseudonocardiales bacterium]|nr:hypothetical protein [Pseudonocardiales bacterium]